MTVYSDINFTGSTNPLLTFVSGIGNRLAESLGLPLGALLVLTCVMISIIMSRQFPLTKSLSVTTLFGLILSLLLRVLGWTTNSTVIIMAISFVIALFFLFKGGEQ